MGLIYLTPLAAHFFLEHGFDLVDNSNGSTNAPEQSFDWGRVKLRQMISAFQHFDSIHLEVSSPGMLLTENITFDVPAAKPQSRLMFDLAALPISFADGLSGQNFGTLAEGTPTWLSAALADYTVKNAMHMGGRTQLQSTNRHITLATALKVRINRVEPLNMQPILPISQAAERYETPLAEMNYDD